MATVADILSYVESIAPPYMKESWDNVGLNCGHMDRPVTKILVALDPFSHVCHEAKQIGADLLVTHHALIWKPGFITDLNNQGRNTLFLIENGIAHINAHTNLDQAPGGVNDVLAAKLGLENVQIINPKDGRVEGVIDCRGLLPRHLRTPQTDVLNGIAYNPEDGKIYLTGKNWPELYEIRLIEK